MIAISESLIKSTRSNSWDDAAPPTTSLFDTLISGSPTAEEEERIVYQHSLCIAAMEKTVSDEEAFKVPPARTTSGKGALGGKESRANSNAASDKGVRGKAKVVRFSASRHEEMEDTVGSIASVRLSSHFTKEPFQKTAQVSMASSLSKELSLHQSMDFGGRADFSRSNKSKAPSSLELSVFLAENTKPLKVVVKGGSVVEDVIEQVIFEAEVQELALETDEADAYELRILDDEDEGIADTDLPPLDRTRDVRSLGTTAFALVRVDGESNFAEEVGAMAKERAPSVSSRKSRSISLEMNLGGLKGERFFVRIKWGEETHVLPCTERMVFQELLPVLSKKKRLEGEETLLPQHYRFSILNDPEQTLDMGGLISESKADQFELAKKMPDMVAAPMMKEMNIEAEDGMKFTIESACAYSEYTVVKTNSRGRKQKRVLGIDENTIYNKPPRVVGTSTTSTLSSFQPPSFMRRSSIEVQKATRPISSITACERIENKDMCFSVTFDDLEKRKSVSREYKTETLTECREIVSKIQFLIEHHRRRNRKASTSKNTASASGGSLIHPSAHKSSKSMPAYLIPPSPRANN